MKNEHRILVKLGTLGTTTGFWGMLSQALNDRYRCPENFFEFVLKGQLSSEVGYFRFGPNTSCFGRSHSEVCGPRRAHDALKCVTVDCGRLSLPFDPTEIIENLRMERYADSQDLGTGFRYAFKSLYYLLRPLTNLPVRKQIQKFHARSGRRLAFPKWPVDTTVEDLCEGLFLLSMEAKGVEKVPFIWFWPAGAASCALITHDVETEVGRDRCIDLMDVDDLFGIKASFQVVPEGRYVVSPSLLEVIRQRGFEVGIQDLNHDGRLFDDKEQFLRRAKIINHYGHEYGARGFRAAVLYRKPEWYDALEFAFDMSIPNVALLDPQRGGCCTVMPYFIKDILELPVTTVQDYTLFHILDRRSIDLWKTQLGLIRSKNGLASFIIHPDFVMQQDTLPVYKDLLNYLRELRENALIWCALPSEVDSWWRARSKMSLVEAGNSWRIEGDESGRAVLAYAKNVNGNLVYELDRPAGPSGFSTGSLEKGVAKE